MATLPTKKTCNVLLAIEKFTAILATIDISIEAHQDFSLYTSIRRNYGDIYLNQAFDPKCTCFDRNDFWLLARRRQGDEVATYCVRRFNIDDFYQLVRTKTLWFPWAPDLIPRQCTIDCEIPPFGGEILHGGGLWVRRDFRGWSRLAFVLPRLARALSLLERAFDHDTGMIRSAATDSPTAAKRKAVFAAVHTYGFARVGRFVDGWFPHEGRNAIMHLCHSTKAEAMASLLDQVPAGVLSADNQKNAVPRPADEVADRL